ncbi:MAG: alpha/beta fold hydrolase [Proteobacteria bacterium]|nr:alpha/beta fold hydrolase [Pseudomonadota bacterium]
MASEKVGFEGSGGNLAARLDTPDGPIRAYALFAHCFTCSKDIFAASRIARALADEGIAVLRFDFTGLGASDGEFENTNFSSNLEDLRYAAEFLRQNHEAPKILIGHSLGGAAVLGMAEDVPEAVAVATIAAPFDPEHVAHNFKDSIEIIENKGEAEVSLAGRTFTIKRQFLDDISSQNQQERIANLRKALLIFHAPGDESVGIENAGLIYATAKHPKSFVSLDGADHLVSRHADANYIAKVIAAWATRYLAAEPESHLAPKAAPGQTIVTERGIGGFAVSINSSGHALLADEPAGYGGLDTGPTPYGLLLSSLGACTAMTLRMYAERKNLPLERVTVELTHKKIHAEDCTDCETKVGKIDEINRRLTIEGDELSADQRQRLLEIADKCPVHRTLESEVKIRTEITA